MACLPKTALLACLVGAPWAAAELAACGGEEDCVAALQLKVKATSASAARYGDVITWTFGNEGQPCREVCSTRNSNCLRSAFSQLGDSKTSPAYWKVINEAYPPFEGLFSDQMAGFDYDGYRPAVCVQDQCGSTVAGMLVSKNYGATDAGQGDCDSKPIAGFARYCPCIQDYDYYPLGGPYGSGFYPGGVYAQEVVGVRWFQSEPNQDCREACTLRFANCAEGALKQATAQTVPGIADEAMTTCIAQLDVTNMNGGQGISDLEEYLPAICLSQDWCPLGSGSNAPVPRGLCVVSQREASCDGRAPGGLSRLCPCTKTG